MIKFDDNPDELSSFEYTIAQIINFDFGFWKFFPHFVGYVAHIVGKYRKEQARAATLQYPAEIGERIKKVPVTVQSVKEFFGNYGSTFLIQFRTDHSHALKTFYSGNDRFNEGDKVLLTGTVKAQEDNQYGKGTMLSRIKVDSVK